MNWVQVYRDDVIASIFGTPLTGFGRYSGRLETASLELNAHLRVQPAHCVYDFYFSDFSTMPYRRPYNAVVRYAITSNDHHITPQIQLHQICGARRCSIINTPSGRVILHPPFLTESCRGVPVYR